MVIFLYSEYVKFYKNIICQKILVLLMLVIVQFDNKVFFFRDKDWDYYNSFFFYFFIKVYFILQEGKYDLILFISLYLKLKDESGFFEDVLVFMFGVIEKVLVIFGI